MQSCQKVGESKIIFNVNDIHSSCHVLLFQNRNVHKSNVSAILVIYLNPSTKAQDLILKD